MRIVGGIWANQYLSSPGRRVRPTQEDVRVAWMEHLGPRIEGARVLDLFSGTGALGLEALSRGAASVDFVESGHQAMHSLKANIAARKLKPLKKGQRPSVERKSIRLFKKDAIQFAGRLRPESYDLAFADPPYDSLKLDRILSLWHERRFAKVFCVEHAPDREVPSGGRTWIYEHSGLTFYGM
ncbi:MAG: RsmD family RNA methyltransferase [Bradymonadia bacterium]